MGKAIRSLAPAINPRVINAFAQLVVRLDLPPQLRRDWEMCLASDNDNLMIDYIHKTITGIYSRYLEHKYQGEIRNIEREIAINWGYSVEGLQR